MDGKIVKTTEAGWGEGWILIRTPRPEKGVDAKESWDSVKRGTTVFTVFPVTRQKAIRIKTLDPVVVLVVFCIPQR